MLLRHRSGRQQTLPVGNLRSAKHSLHPPCALWGACHHQTLLSGYEHALLCCSQHRAGLHSGGRCIVAGMRTDLM